MKKLILQLFFIILLFASCGSPDYNKPYSDTPTTGKVKVSADETLQPIADAEKDTFMGLYRYSTINISHKSEVDCFNDLLNDSAKVIITSRKLNDKEDAVFKEHHLYPVTTKVAIDALALIVNNENEDTLITLSQLKELLSGKLNSWKQLNAKSPLSSITFVFDNKGSSNVRYLRDSINNGSAFPAYCFAAKSNEDVVNYVEQNKNAIGVIGISWVSDRDDPKAMQFLHRIRVMEIATKENPVFPDDYFKPYQAYIALKQYPLVRNVYMINREGRAGLGTGFVSFVAGDQGQRIVRLSGLLPATMPVRIIQTQ